MSCNCNPCKSPTACPGNLRTAMLKGINGVLSARDLVGAVIKPCYILTRTWFKDSAKTIVATQPEGYATDSVPVQICPSPSLKDYSQDIRLREGGALKAGDIVLKNISQGLYTFADLDSKTASKNIEKLYLVGDKLYQVINITEQLLTFSVQLRELTNQKRYS